jgi:hypothetical protein
VQTTGGWVKKREPGRRKKKKRGACNVMCDARWRGGLLDFGWAGRVGRGERGLIEDADRVRVSSQAGVGALSVARQLACCGAALRRQVAAYGIRRRSFVCCLLLLCPYVYVHVHVMSMSAVDGPKAEMAAAARRHGSCETNYSGLFWGPRSSAVVCRRHARPLAPRVSWLAGFETVRSALDPGPGPFYLSAPTSPPGPHVHMSTCPRRPLPRQLDLKCRPCPPARWRPLIHHLHLHPSIPSTIACCDYCPLPARCTVLRHRTPRYPTPLEFWTAAPPEPLHRSCRSYLTSSPLHLHCLLYTSPALAT